MTRLRLAVVAAALVLGPISVFADTLFMRDGTRIRGELVAVRNGVIEFEERRGFGSGRTIRVDRDEVARIEFDDSGNSGGGNVAGGGRPGGMRERQVMVAANTPWNDSGIEVRAGQTIYVEASGNVTWGAGRRDGPEGEHSSPSNPSRPMPNRPAAALIGKVGQGNDVFFIGDDSGPIRVRNAGRLYLGVNDDVLNDNRGSFRVIVYY
jgi:hypothetical protein